MILLEQTSTPLNGRVPWVFFPVSHLISRVITVIPLVLVIRETDQLVQR
jgi:hypothetical protein